MTSPRKNAAWKLAAPIAAALALAAPEAAAQTPPPNACVPKDNAVRPTMDGRVGNGVSGFTEDAGWSGASVIALQDTQGTNANPTSLLKLKSTDSALYLGAVLQGGQIMESNTVLLGVEVTSGGGMPVSSWKFIINPFSASETGGAAYSSHNLFASTHYAKYWSDPSTFTNSAAGLDIPSNSWLGSQGGGDFGFVFSKETDNVTDATHPGRWSFEVKIPRVATAADNTIQKGIFFGAGNQVRIYFNVLTTNTLLAPNTNLYEQYPWPRATTISDGGALVDSKMPPSTDWATLTLDTQCGVSLQHSDFGVLKNGSITTTISTGLAQGASFTAADCASSDPAIFTTNTLVAVPSSNQPMPANVTLNFDVTGFGIPGSTFLTHVATNNVTIPANSNLQVTSSWALTKSQVCKLVTTGPDHQCFRVNMTSSNATVLTPSLFNNLYWGSASRFTDKAVIDTAGLPKPASGQHKILLRVSDQVLSERFERELEKKGWRPPVCSNADPLSKSEFCACSKEADIKLQAKLGEIAAHPKTHNIDPQVLQRLQAEAVKMCSPLREKAEAAAAKRRFQTLHRTVQAYAITDNRLTIRGGLYQEAKYMGAYAYMVRHFIEGNPEQVDVGWLPAQLGGEGLELKRVQADGSGAPVEGHKPAPRAPGVLVRKTPDTSGVISYTQYVLDTPAGKPVFLSTKLDAKEGPKGSFDSNDRPPKGGDKEDPKGRLGGNGQPTTIVCGCPSNAAGSTTALPAPTEIKMAGLSFVALAGLRLRRRRRQRSE